MMECRLQRFCKLTEYVPPILVGQFADTDCVSELKSNKVWYFIPKLGVQYNLAPPTPQVHNISAPSTYQLLSFILHDPPQLLGRQCWGQYRLFSFHYAVYGDNLIKTAHNIQRGEMGARHLITSTTGCSSLVQDSWLWCNSSNLLFRLRRRDAPLLKTSCIIPVPEKNHPGALQVTTNQWLWLVVNSSLDPLLFVYQTKVRVDDTIIHMLHRAGSHLKRSGSTVRVVKASHSRSDCSLHRQTWRWGTVAPLRDPYSELIVLPAEALLISRVQQGTGDVLPVYGGQYMALGLGSCTGLTSCKEVLHCDWTAVGQSGLEDDESSSSQSLIHNQGSK